MKNINDWWDDNIRYYWMLGRGSANKGEFDYPNTDNDDPNDADENQAYKDGFMERRKELGDLFKWG